MIHYVGHDSAILSTYLLALPIFVRHSCGEEKKKKLTFVECFTYSQSKVFEDRRL